MATVATACAGATVHGDCGAFNDWYCAQQNHAAIMDAIERYIRARVMAFHNAK